MGRMYSAGKGISSSALPYRRSAPSWVKTGDKDIAELKATISNLAKKGYSPAKIGIELRDKHGIPQVKQVTNSKILRILSSLGQAPEIPEDLNYLLEKATRLKKHLAEFPKNKNSKNRLIIVQSRLARLVRYYKTKGSVSASWKLEEHL